MARLTKSKLPRPAQISPSSLMSVGSCAASAGSASISWPFLVRKHGPFGRFGVQMARMPSTFSIATYPWCRESLASSKSSASATASLCASSWRLLFQPYPFLSRELRSSSSSSAVGSTAAADMAVTIGCGGSMEAAPEPSAEPPAALPVLAAPLTAALTCAAKRFGGGTTSSSSSSSSSSLSGPPRTM